MIHPDDRHALGDWELFGPRNEAISKLVKALAERGQRLDDIERLIESTLRLRLAELEAASENQV
jgi:hypothetical protein